MGLTFARALAYAARKPVVGVDHLEAHVYAAFLEHEVPFPYIALLVSGGHSELVLMRDHGIYQQLGCTLDDAAGEAFDKVAKLLGIPYPGGAVIDRLSRDGDPASLKLPRPLLHDGTLNMSFSGLKTAVMTYLKQHPPGTTEKALPDLCASFQSAVCDVLVTKAGDAVRRTGGSRLVISGGVACNSGLRAAMAQYSKESGTEIFFPSPVLCADNAAMLAVPGNFYLENGCCDIDFDALPQWSLDSICTPTVPGRS